jgi:uncharacterized protein (TIGR03435 family)
MAWTKTKTTVTTGVAVLVLVAMAVAVKLVFFPSVSGAFFQPNAGKLRQAPANVVIIRPTHFANSARSGIISTSTQLSGKSVRRILGRDVPLRDIISVAYNQSPAHIVLPSDAPKGNYDFLVTVSDNPEARLQSAIKKKLGYTAQKEKRDTDVLALKIENPNSPGLKVSPDSEKENTDVKNGRLYFTHMLLGVITDGLQQMLKTPVVDETGLTNFYDFSLVWDTKTQRMLQNGTMDNETGQKILAGWGLGLEPDTASIEMLVVKKAN